MIWSDLLTRGVDRRHPHRPAQHVVHVATLTADARPRRDAVGREHSDALRSGITDLHAGHVRLNTDHPVRCRPEPFPPDFARGESVRPTGRNSRHGCILIARANLRRAPGEQSSHLPVAIRKPMDDLSELGSREAPCPQSH